VPSDVRLVARPNVGRGKSRDGFALISSHAGSVVQKSGWHLGGLSPSSRNGLRWEKRKALGFLAHERNVPLNLGLSASFKPAFLGVPVSDPWKVAKYVNQVFTATIVVLTVAAARKNGPPQMRAATWLTILTLGTLRSPFAPGYVTFPVAWLLSVSSTEIRGVRATILLVVVWLMLSLPTPLPLPQLTIFSFVQRGVITTLLMYSVFRGSTRPPLDLLSACARRG
jgi:hypothetical protein